MFNITKSFTFDAAHRLFKLPTSHKCSNIHGHTYRVDVSITVKELDEYDFVIDFGELRWFKNYLDDNFDHKILISLSDPLLNDLQKILPTTNLTVFPIIENQESSSELMCKHFYNIVKEWLVKNIDKSCFVSINVWETPTSKSSYSEMF